MMSDWPEAVREYEEYKARHRPGPTLQRKADAAIATLKAEVLRFAGLLNACDKQNYFLKEANERAEAELAALSAGVTNGDTFSPDRRA